jgi:hypothetical protein
MAAADPSLISRQPWKAVVEKEYDWLGGAILKHYDGDDGDLKVMAGGLLQAYAGRTSIKNCTPDRFGQQPNSTAPNPAGSRLIAPHPREEWPDKSPTNTSRSRVFRLRRDRPPKRSIQVPS